MATQVFHPAISKRAVSTFRLDPSIYNRTLYKQITDVWLPNVDLEGEVLSPNALKQWFLASPDERIAFDGVCRENFAHALEAVGPEAMPTPSAQPFIDEITRIGVEDSLNGWSDAAWAALSLTLLLDQIARNVFRTDDGLRKVYNHYDRIAYELARSLLSPSSIVARVDLHPQWRNSTAYRAWFYMPLMHSEDIEAHNFLDEIMQACAEDLEKLEGHEGSKRFLNDQLKSEREHREILDRFGRYPHRNEALGRESTEEERKFLEEGGATFGVTQGKGAL